MNHQHLGLDHDGARSGVVIGSFSSSRKRGVGGDEVFYGGYEDRVCNCICLMQLSFGFSCGALVDNYVKVKIWIWMNGFNSGSEDLDVRFVS